LGRGNALLRAANGTKSRDDFQLAMRFLALADTLRRTPQSAFLLGVAAYSITQSALSDAPKMTEKTQSCELSHLGAETLPVARAGLEAGQEEEKLQIPLERGSYIRVRVVTVDTNMPGIYNHENLVGVVAVAASLGIELPAIARATRRFLGVRRRQEVRGVARGVTVVDDFAHHPTAIRETVLALKGRHGPGKLIAAFEPRSATSRRNIFQQAFADALSVADEVVLAPLYAPEKVPEAVRATILALGRYTRATASAIQALEKQWNRYRKQPQLDRDGQPEAAGAAPRQRTRVTRRAPQE